MDEKVLRHLVDLVWQHATESKAVPSTTTADMLIAKAFEGEKHTYPERHGPVGGGPRFKVAWEILDQLKPGVLSLCSRALLAGMIAGAVENEVQRRTREKS